MPPRINKNGKPDGRANNAKNALKARNALSAYIKKGKALRDEADDEEEEVVNAVEPMPEVDNEEYDIRDSDFDTSEEEVEDIVVVKKKPKVAPKKKKVRRIVYEESSDDDADVDFKKILASYKKMNGEGRSEMQEPVPVKSEPIPVPPRQLTVNEIMANKLRASFVNY